VNLKDFVAQSIIEIIEGIKNAQAHFENDEDVLVAPRIRPTENSSIYVVEQIDSDGRTQYLPRAWMIQFDVSVAVTQQAGKDGGAALTVCGIGMLGGKKIQSNEHSEFSRISFEIPVQWPYDQNKQIPTD